MSRNRDVLVGDVVQYQNKDYTIAKMKCKFLGSTNFEDQWGKRIVATFVNEKGEKRSATFYPYYRGTQDLTPNVYIKNDGTLALSEISDNDIVDIYGFEYDYINRDNVTVTQINAWGGYELSNEEFNLVSSINNGSSLDVIKSLVALIKEQTLSSTCLSLFSSDLVSDFCEKPAAHSHHHNYVGGLLQHTREVMQLVNEMNNCFIVDNDVVITAALFHDIAKVYEYDIYGQWQPYGSLVGHVVGSADLFRKFAIYNKCPDNLINEVYHCILAHHGKKEWGSPVEPQTMEAWVLHMADNLSSKINSVADKKADMKDYYLK